MFLIGRVFSIPFCANGVAQTSGRHSCPQQWPNAKPNQTLTFSLRQAGALLRTESPRAASSSSLRRESALDD
jgi:hypothetical protein